MALSPITQTGKLHFEQQKFFSRASSFKLCGFTKINYHNK